MTVIGSAISWTNSTFNPWVGCVAVSDGCSRCYARTLVEQRWGKRFDVVDMRLERLSHVKRFRPIADDDGSVRPHLVFVNSMSDFFFEQVPDAAIHTVLDEAEMARHVTWQILTKRPVRARKMLVERYRGKGIPRHIWIGVTAEDQRVARRLDMLRSIRDRTGGATLFASVEPIVGPTESLDFSGVDWVIVGGESGPGARVMQAAWLMAAIEGAKSAQAAIWLKQHGQILSNPLLHHAPDKLPLARRYRWLIDNGLELLGFEKGGATLEGGVTYRELPKAFYEQKAALNEGTLI